LRTYRLDRVRSTQDSIHYHTRILEFVKASDAEGARQAMHDHLVSSREWTRRVLESQESDAGAGKRNEQEGKNT
ncbi:MAG: FCD domain-containing protein, partial [Burkholderiales bacterium]